MIRTRTVMRVALLFAGHALARQVDVALGALLHTSLDVPGLVWHVPALLDPARVGAALVFWMGAGVAVSMSAAYAVRRGEAIATAIDRATGAFTPLLLRPVITLMALASVALRPTYPYGFTLPVALTQDWSVAQDGAVIAAVAVGLWSLARPAGTAAAVARVRISPPGSFAVFFVFFLVYALLSPPWARQWESHPGNEPKTLRMAVAIGHGLTLDVEGVTGPMEELSPRPMLSSAAGALRTLALEAARMGGAVLAGPAVVGAGGIRATRVTRQTVEGKEGGVYHVLAPGPSLLLAPALRIDRALNVRSGRVGRLAVTLLLWNALAAALVAAIFALVRDATGRGWLAATLAGSFALTPPFLFYFYQFYPEMLGALSVAVLLRLLLLAGRWTARSATAASLVLCFLPWLHQKFLPVWLILALMAVVKAVDEMTTLGTLSTLVLPQAASAFLFALYNFAITGSVRPDALFLAWGPAGVATTRLGEGALGLLLDARYGILPYAPVYALGFAGLLLPGRAATRLRLALLAMAVYYLTVAAADNWSGAVCSLGRYFMPVAPFLVALGGIALARAGGRRAALVTASLLVVWTGLVSTLLWRDPFAANDCALLLDRSTYADGHVYVPDLFFRSPRFEAPGHVVRVVAWLAAVAVGALWWRWTVARPERGSAAGALAWVAALVLVGAFALERWPSAYRTPRFREAIEVRPGTTVFAKGGAVDGDAVRASRSLDLLVRTRSDLQSLDVLVAGEGMLALAGQAPMRLLPGGSRLEVPLHVVRSLSGRRGLRETLCQARLAITGEARVLFLVDNQGNIGR